jgi:hypothetical protein
MLWDVNEAQNTEALVEDFLTRAFGPAKEPMRDFYRQLDGSKPHLIVADQLGRMFRALYRARQLAYTPDIHARLDDLVLYARYVDLYLRYEKARGPARQRAFETLIRHAYQMRTTMMVHTKALYRDLARRDKSVSIPSEAEWNVPDDKNPWKFSQTFTGKTLANYLAEGIRRYPLTKMDFQPVIYSDDLVGTNILQFPDMPAGKLGASRGKQIFYTRVEQAPTTLELLITGGLIPHYRDRGNVVIDLWKLGGPSSTEEIEKLVMTDRSVPPDGNVHNVKLTVEEPGLYKLTVSDGRDRTRVKWNSSLPLTIKSTLEEPMNLNYSAPWDMYFYVPKSTKVIGLFGGKDGEVIDSLGRHVFSLKDREPNYYSFAVPDGENGKLWRIHNARRSIMLLTVPPYFARKPTELLLPKEVVLQDSMQ